MLFRPNITLSKSWGYITSDGSFDGLVGALQRKQIDYGSSPLFVRTDRAEVMEYGRRTWTLRAAFIFRNPKTVVSIGVFTKPLSTSIWLSLFFTSSCVLFILKLTQSMEKTKVNRKSEASWSYLIICAVGVFCQQGVTNLPFTYSGRITMLFMIVLSYLVYQFYSASIVSNLLIKPKTLIKSVEDILKSTMRAGCEDILYNRDYFLYTSDKPSKDLYLQKILSGVNNSNFLTPQEGLDLVKEGGYAFHVELATAYPIIQSTFSERSMCELREVQMYRTQPMHSNLQKYSPFRDMFDTCLQRLAEYGILDKEITFWHPNKPECVQSKDALNFHLGIEYFYPVLTLLLIGIVLSLIILILELYVNFKHRVEKFKKIVPLYPFTN
ncbi:unnamed protein product [Psylliodes chrysocephalus]|uniref:Ionotropic glutamate receptor C-terminal domain-containing protein n=1 Tax=Psylliodes chrysocephalus TaxID=3402493 RepID=A0A9P0GH85_9CUCU|nr:unnamed protein product [Psylliodes chrysocephala]